MSWLDAFINEGIQLPLDPKSTREHSVRLVLSSGEVRIGDGEECFARQ